MIVKLDQSIDQVLYKENLCRNLCWKCAPETSPWTLFSFGKYSKIYIANVFENKIHWKRIIKNPLFSNLVFFYGQYYNKQKAPRTSNQSLLRLPVMSRSFLSLLINHLINFDTFHQRLFLCIQKTIENLCKPFHDIIVTPFWKSS